MQMIALLLLAAAPSSTSTAAIDAAMHADEADQAKCMDNPNNYAQQRMNACAAASFERADAALNAQWAKTLKVYRQSDTDNKAIGADLADGAENLLKGQRAWLIYRDATCRAMTSLSGGGSIAPLNFSICMADLTWKRVNELSALTINPNSGEQM